MSQKPDHGVVFDAAIVLGAMVLSDGRPSKALARRVDHAVALARVGKVGNLIMTGGPVSHRVPEAFIMRDRAIAAGIEAERIVVEDRSRNTIENVHECAFIAKGRSWRRLMVVTDAYHIPRALYVFHRFGLPVSPSAAWPERTSPEWVLAAFRETLALPWTMARVEWRRLGRR